MGEADDSDLRIVDLALDGSTSRAASSATAPTSASCACASPVATTSSTPSPPSRWACASASPSTSSPPGSAAFTGTGRRMELKGEVGGVRVYDSYAHHHVEIAGDLQAARSLVGDGRRRGRLPAPPRLAHAHLRRGRWARRWARPTRSSSSTSTSPARTPTRPSPAAWSPTPYPSRPQQVAYVDGLDAVPRAGRARPTRRPRHHPGRRRHHRCRAAGPRPPRGCLSGASRSAATRRTRRRFARRQWARRWIRCATSWRSCWSSRSSPRGLAGVLLRDAAGQKVEVVGNDLLSDARIREIAAVPAGRAARPRRPRPRRRARRVARRGQVARRHPRLARRRTHQGGRAHRRGGRRAGRADPRARRRGRGLPRLQGPRPRACRASARAPPPAPTP